MPKQLTLEFILLENSSYTNTHVLKQKLIKHQLLRNECYLCGLTHWRGRELSLHLDHINGINNDHRIENLRLLCPNCHSQTNTYCKRKKPALQHFCRDCSKPVHRQSLRCKSCALRQRGYKIKWPSPEVLRELVRATSYLATARKLGVSDTAIRKYLAQSARENQELNAGSTT